MYEGFVTIVIFIGVMAIAGVLFAGWLLVMAFRGLASLVTRMLGGGPAAPPPVPANSVTCRHERCRAPNPSAARFCRRCGRSIDAAAADVAVRRVAML